MWIDDSRAPFVFLRADVPADTGIEAQFEQLLARERRFVLLTDHSPGDHHDESAEERRAKALFIKRVKDRLRQWCVGMIVIERGDPLPKAARLAAAAASKAFGFSMGFVSSEDEGLRQGQAWLDARDTPPVSPRTSA
ncbi:hypothetical protein [Mitsuaria sp. GD03876]|uniref:hypothetical protein n=1 Tax=Mitsuaria sp. GD03876 TaxID=2975399 RepID=UPI002446C299|nr:hypothetical protein [Mitsuaria sp. GD03876]MDH0863843.1 hypothetical protein [Mitsuaria sp. GD03876]